MLTRLCGIRHHDNDAGLTLAEVLVGASLAGIAGVMGMTLFVVVSNQAGTTMNREQLTASNRQALAQVASELQYADSPTANAQTAEGRFEVSADGRFEVFQPNKIVFYANRYADSRTGSQSRTPPSRIGIEQVLDPATASLPAYNRKYNLVETIWDPIAKYGGAAGAYPNPYSYTGNYSTKPTQTIMLANGIANDLNNRNEDLFTYCSSAPDPAPKASPTAPATASPTGSAGTTASPSATPTATSSVIPSVGDSCRPIVWTGDSQKDPAAATRISSVLVRLKVVGDGTTRANATQYQPATWLTTRVAIAGRVDVPVTTTTAAAP